MNRTFSIFVAAALLLGSSSAEAARGTAGSNSNLLLPPQPPISSTPLIPQTNPIGGVNQSVGVVSGLPQTNPIGGAGTGQNFGALPGDPGSPTYNPNAALPPLNNPAGTSASGITTPSTTGTTTSHGLDTPAGVGLVSV